MQNTANYSCTAAIFKEIQTPKHTGAATTRATHNHLLLVRPLLLRHKHTKPAIWHKHTHSQHTDYTVRPQADRSVPADRTASLASTLVSCAPARGSRAAPVPSNLDGRTLSPDSDVGQKRRLTRTLHPGCYKSPSTPVPAIHPGPPDGDLPCRGSQEKTWSRPLPSVRPSRPAASQPPPQVSGPLLLPADQPPLRQ
ncbi:uncharacterized protein LOC132197645 [Neocloeon triangulifer]|uniref:uncharacterized protein LOC132197645 n=1 Tax=Neocloeon triangulifer TaxID=2078957 RepID=UPI00286F7B25|nr:uncharacterized protein LOC132197645 [Neocloeon triangulifer]